MIAETATICRELVAKVEQYANADYIVLDGPSSIVMPMSICLRSAVKHVVEKWTEVRRRLEQKSSLR